MDDIIADLESDDTNSLGTRVDGLELAENQLIKARSGLGAKLRRVEVTTELTADIRAQLSQESQRLGDADIAAVISNLMTQEQSLQAAVQVAGRTMTPSLLDVL